MNQNISQSELVIMKLLWQQSPLNAQQINDLIEAKNWRKATVKTLINRLLKKGFISYQQQGRTYYYQPTVDRASYLTDQNQSFLEDLYDGSFTDMMAAFTSHEQLSEAEIKEIKRMIDQLEKSS